MEYEQTETINGYQFVIPYNEIIARQIDYDGMDYKLKHSTDCYCTEIFKIFGREKKNIGKLIFNPDTKRLVLHKFINLEKHEMKTTAEFGINEKIFKNLRACDLIAFHVNNVCYTITVAKAIKVGNYKYFKGSYNAELQAFIPIVELKELKGTKNVKRRRNKK